ncbi:NAD-dependent deacetylase [Alcaligenaceae bacterium]|nr:NAD-dependent deacetylase [Alcaligenaceae bacterium]
MGIHDYEFVKAAQLISHADALLITAGAGMGVDSGLPDFRGAQGFWQRYPALKASGIVFEEMASPRHFRIRPELGWGFYGHRLNLYRKTSPHEGFHILHQIAARLRHNAFVFTSNVDGHFQKADFPDDRVVECHGSIHYLQCLDSCSPDIWPAERFEPAVDDEQCLLMNEPPACPNCGGLARPNILMFEDLDWIEARSMQQRMRLNTWLWDTERPIVIELGAGTALPVVRQFGERQKAPLIRINPFEPELPNSIKHVSLPYRALDALSTLKMALEDIHFFGGRL